MDSRTMGKIIGIGLVCLLLTGCVANPTQEQIANAYYGERPNPLF